MLSRTTSPSTTEFKTGRPYQLSQESQSSKGLKTNLSWMVTYELYYWQTYCNPTSIFSQQSRSFLFQ